MKPPSAAALFVCILLLLPVRAQSQNASLEITEETLNRLVGRLGTIAEAGVFQPTTGVTLPPLVEICFPLGFLECPLGGSLDGLGFSDDRIPLLHCKEVGGGFHIVPDGPAVSWQWWVSEPHYTLTSGAMTFTATVYRRVDGVPKPAVTRTVPASVSFDPNTNRLRIQIDAFFVSLELPESDFTLQPSVDVARLYSISIPIEPQNLSIPRPDGGSATVTARVVGITPEYLAGRIRVRIDLGF